MVVAVCLLLPSSFCLSEITAADSREEREAQRRDDEYVLCLNTILGKSFKYGFYCIYSNTSICSQTEGTGKHGLETLWTFYQQLPGEPGPQHRLLFYQLQPKPQKVI